MEPNPVEVDPAQIDIDLGHIQIRDPNTREILRRQMEKGSITHTDITTLQKYQQSWNYSRIGLVGGAIATSVWGRFVRRPPLPIGRLFGLSSLAAFTGASLGTGLQVRAGIQAVNSLENPDRFKKALIEMSRELLAQRQAALRRSPESQQPTNGPQNGEETKLADGWDSRSRQVPGVQVPGTSAAPPSDRWSQLRAQKPTTQPTTWDSIRQTHERSSPDTSVQDNQPAAVESDEEKRRRQAQADFDALLAQERGMGQDNTPELKSRWS